MQNFSKSNNTFVLMGDYNVDLSKQNIDNKIQQYVNEIYSSGCFSLINKPTKILISGILISDVSDHLPTFCILKSNIHRSFIPRIMMRDMKKFNVEAFSEDVNNKLEYQSHSLNDDPNTEIHNILTAITEATNLHAPLTKLSRKKMKIKAKPWLTKELLECISIKNKLFEQCYKQNRLI